MEKIKVALLPLDERTCNFSFPMKLFGSNQFQIVKPEKLGEKKTPANMDDVVKFLLEECNDVDAAVISLETLLYGGLIPSRLHNESLEILKQRIDILRKIKEENPTMKIYAFQCIMRCPSYSSDDEEPDYYELYGEQIHKLGNVLHREKLMVKQEYNKEELLSQLPKEIVEDYEKRRKTNLAMCLETLKLVNEGIVDTLVIPQDDSAPLGYTAMDQQVVKEEIAKQHLWDRVYIYPGADEVELTLLARILNDKKKKRPKVYIKYASVHAPFLIPKYEDRSLAETVKSHLMAAGCVETTSISEADFILALSAGAFEMLEAAQQPVYNANYSVERNLIEFVYAIETYLEEGRLVTIGDNAFANGADMELIALLEQKKLLLKLAGYAGWNTSANTIGTAIAEGVRYLYYGNDIIHKNFMVLRYLEDAGYCAKIRQEITKNELPALGMNYFNVCEKEGIVSSLVKKQLDYFAKTYLASIYQNISINRVTMPWRRMFETEIEVSYQEKAGRNL